MSQKNVQYSDFTAVDLESLALLPTGVPMYIFNAKRSGTVRIDCSFAVATLDTLSIAVLEEDVDGADSKIPYAEIQSEVDVLVLSGSIIMQVFGSLKYTIVGLDVNSLPIVSGVLGITYL
jgi:hypothetical protein